MYIHVHIIHTCMHNTYISRIYACIHTHRTYAHAYAYIHARRLTDVRAYTHILRLRLSPMYMHKYIYTRVYVGRTHVYVYIYITLIYVVHLPLSPMYTQARKPRPLQSQKFPKTNTHAYTLPLNYPVTPTRETLF